jgi:hypothetical protein
MTHMTEFDGGIQELSINHLSWGFIGNQCQVRHVRHASERLHKRPVVSGPRYVRRPDFLFKNA